MVCFPGANLRTHCAVLLTACTNSQPSVRASEEEGSCTTTWTVTIPDHNRTTNFSGGRMMLPSHQIPGGRTAEAAGEAVGGNHQTLHRSARLEFCDPSTTRPRSGPIPMVPSHELSQEVQKAASEGLCWHPDPSLPCSLCAPTEHWVPHSLPVTPSARPLPDHSIRGGSRYTQHCSVRGPQTVSGSARRRCREHFSPNPLVPIH